MLDQLVNISRLLRTIITNTVPLYFHQWSSYQKLPNFLDLKGIMCIVRAECSQRISPLLTRPISCINLHIFLCRHQRTKCCAVAVIVEETNAQTTSAVMTSRHE